MKPCCGRYSSLRLLQLVRAVKSPACQGQRVSLTAEYVRGMTSIRVIWRDVSQYSWQKNIAFLDQFRELCNKQKAATNSI
jgi:hypothetical protein